MLQKAQTAQDPAMPQFSEPPIRGGHAPNPSIQMDELSSYEITTLL